MTPGNDVLLMQSDPREPPRRARLLVVDDQASNVQVLYRLFAADHQVLMATNAEQALKVCAQQQPDLVLLDIEMPGLSGYEACRRLKSDPATAGIPVIFVTSHADVAAETSGLEAGAVDFISKPVNPPIVRARVRTHLLLKAQSDLLRSLATIDALTGVYNRRYFDEQFTIECRRASRSHGPLSVLMIDVDHFKHYNDRYGHPAGDLCLQRVAQAIRARLKRPADVVARYGGEEFACLLPDTPLDGALACAEHINAGVRELRLEHASSPTATVVSVSLGVATAAPPDQPPGSELLRSADIQLYRAKESGRDRVCGAMADPASA